MASKVNMFLSASRIAVLVLVSGIFGCVSYDHSGTAVIAQWNSRFGVNTGNRSASSPWNGETTLRDFVYEGIAVKDYEYKKYVDLIRRGTSWGGFGAQAASIGLNAAVPLTGTGTGKTLSAIAGTITGTSAAFSKNILFDQSITIFVGRMDQLRKTKLDQIEAKLKAANYTLAEAYRDIQDYGYQGSLDAAFADVAHETKPTPTPTPTAAPSPAHP
jgi:hypothetical protein